MKSYIKLSVDALDSSSRGGQVQVLIKGTWHPVPIKYVSAQDRVALKDAAKADKYLSGWERGERFLKWGRYISVSLSWRTIQDLPARRVS